MYKQYRTGPDVVGLKPVELISREVVRGGVCEDQVELVFGNDVEEIVAFDKFVAKDPIKRIAVVVIAGNNCG